MNFANVTTIKIPNGEVLKIQETSNGRVLWQKKSIPKDISVFTNHPGVYNATNVDGLFKYINNLPQIQSLKRLNEYSLILRCKESDNIYCMGTNLNLRVLPGTNFPKEDKVTRIPNTFNLYNDPRLIPPSCLNPDPEKRIKDIAYFEDDSIHRYVFLRGYSPQLRETVYTPPMDDTRYNIWEFAVGLSAKLQKSNNSEDMFVLLDELYKIQDGIYYTGYVFAAMSSIKYCTDMRCTYDNKVRHLKKIDYPLALDYDGNVYDITKATYKANVYFVLTTAITNLNVNTIGKVIDCYVSESTNFKFLLNERFELYALGYNGKYNLGLPSPQNYNTYTYVGTYSKLKKTCSD